MSSRQGLRSRLLQGLLDRRYRTLRRGLAELRRRLTLRPHVLQVFLQLDDPYSYLLSYYLAEVARHYKLELRYYLSQALHSEFTPEPALLAEYALADCALLAAEFDVPFLDVGSAPVVEHRRRLLDFLAEEQVEDDFTETFNKALSSYWRGDNEGTARLISRPQPASRDTSVLIGQNQLLLRKLGHYSSAMICYGGEWYWGVDRLQHLLRRLDGLGANRGGKGSARLAAMQQAMQLQLPAAVPDSAAGLPPLEMFHSFRSPYSYLALPRIYKIAAAFGLQLKLRPVLPMVTRGLPVPQQKLRYIVHDANREAERLGAPFGRIADPLGKGVERCMAVFPHAEQQGKQCEFLQAAGIAIFGAAVDVATDEGMRKVTAKAGLSWPEVEAAMAQDDWQSQAAENRAALAATGLWGVPSFRIGEIALWGQDRDWLLARKIEDLCQTGDGILT